MRRHIPPEKPATQHDRNTDEQPSCDLCCHDIRSDMVTMQIIEDESALYAIPRYRVTMIRRPQEERRCISDTLRVDVLLSQPRLSRFRHQSCKSAYVSPHSFSASSNEIVGSLLRSSISAISLSLAISSSKRSLIRSEIDVSSSIALCCKISSPHYTPCPVLPNPPVPRSVASSSSTAVHSARS